MRRRRTVPKLEGRALSRPHEASAENVMKTWFQPSALVFLLAVMTVGAAEPAPVGGSIAADSFVREIEQLMRDEQQFHEAVLCNLSTDVTADLAGVDALTGGEVPDTVELTKGVLVCPSDVDPRAQLIVRSCGQAGFRRELSFKERAKVKVYKGGILITDDVIEVPGDNNETYEVVRDPTWEKLDETVIATLSVIYPGAGVVDFEDVKLVGRKTELHPKDSDFTSGKEGRVMILTSQDDKYYTNVKTTKDNKAAQTQDRKVKITAHLTPAAAAVGQTVYFRVVAPDPDDLSSYESDANTGDNRDTTIGAGTLSAGSNVAELKTINGVSVAAAEVELTITDQYAGDNYQVECSLDAGFPSICDRTAILVAWKRLYLEMDRMYKKGATITQDFSTDLGILDDVLNVDSTADLSVGDQIVIFTKVGVTRDRTVDAKTANTITVADLDVDLDKYSGVRLKNNTDTYNVSLDYIPMTYGDATDGNDGGVFVEFEELTSGAGPIPRYWGDKTPMMWFCRHWFKNVGEDDYVQLVASGNPADPGTTLGFTVWLWNISAVLVPQHGCNDAKIKNSVVHELGHQFHVSGAHVDSTTAHPNHAGTDRCVMTYASDSTDGIAELCTDCIYEVRDGVVPE